MMRVKWFVPFLWAGALGGAMGCQSVPRPEMGALSDDPGAAGAQTLAYRSVELLAREPAERFAEVGPVIAFVERPIRGVTVNVAAPWRYASIPSQEDGIGSSPHRTTRLLDAPETPAESALQRALQTRAAEMGADALVLRNAGIDQNGRLWASGTAIRRQ